MKQPGRRGDAKEGLTQGIMSVLPSFPFVFTSFLSSGDITQPIFLNVWKSNIIVYLFVKEEWLWLTGRCNPLKSRTWGGLSAKTSSSLVEDLGRCKGISAITDSLKRRASVAEKKNIRKEPSNHLYRIFAIETATVREKSTQKIQSKNWQWVPNRSKSLKLRENAEHSGSECGLVDCCP